MNQNFEKNILDINGLIENNTSIFSNFSFIFNVKVLLVLLVISFSLYLLLYFFKEKLYKNKFIATLTRPMTHSILLSISVIIFLGIFMLDDTEGENENLIYKNINTEYLGIATVSYPLKEIKLMSLDVPTYNIQYEKDGYFQKYKTRSYDFVANKIGLFHRASLFNNVDLNGNNFNKTAINISQNDEVFFIDNKLLEKELNKIEKNNNIDLSFIKESLLSNLDNEIYKINLKEETFNKMIKKGVDE